MPQLVYQSEEAPELEQSHLGAPKLAGRKAGVGTVFIIVWSNYQCLSWLVQCSSCYKFDRRAIGLRLLRGSQTAGCVIGVMMVCQGVCVRSSNLQIVHSECMAPPRSKSSHLRVMFCETLQDCVPSAAWITGLSALRPKVGLSALWEAGPG